MAKSKAQKALAAGPSKIGAKARAAANKLKKSTGPKHAKPGNSDESKSYSSYGNLSTGKHSSEVKRGGKHHAPSAQSAVKNAYGSTSAPSRGRHSKEAAAAGTAPPNKPLVQSRPSAKSEYTARSFGRKLRGK
jgi:hypothetical protein